MVKQDDPLGGAAIQGVRAESWQRLCDLAGQLHRLAPWRWMSEEEVFGVRLPGSDRIGFVSVMGEIGEHLACTVYLGWDALRRVQEVFSGRDMTFRDVVETPQLQVSFEDRGVLTAEERALLRSLGRSYRGRQAWPVFRSHRPGYLPWLLDQQEADWLAHVVNQAIGMAMRREDAPGLLVAEQPNSFLVRGQDAAGDWQEEWLAMPAPVPRGPPVAFDAKQVEGLRRMGPVCNRLQVDLSLSQSIIGQRGQRPQTAYMLALIDAETGYCLAVEMVQALQGVEEMWGSVPGRLLPLLARAGGYPREIEVASDEMMGVLRPLSERLPCRLTRLAHLDQVDAFVESMAELYAKKGRAGG